MFSLTQNLGKAKVSYFNQPAAWMWCVCARVGVDVRDARTYGAQTHIQAEQPCVTAVRPNPCVCLHAYVCVCVWVRVAVIM